MASASAPGAGGPDTPPHLLGHASKQNSRGEDAARANKASSLGSAFAPVAIGRPKIKIVERCIEQREQIRSLRRRAQ
jgi:hypothetical protein